MKSIVIIPCSKGAKKMKKKTTHQKLSFQSSINYFKASFKAFPALKAGYLLASISIVSPVCKLRP